MPPAPLTSDLSHLLLVPPTWVGDTVMATPVLRAVRAALPGARITALVRPGLDELLDGGGWIDEVVGRSDRGIIGPWRAARAIRSVAPFDAALLLPNSFRSALTVRLARIPVRIGYDRDGRGRLLTHPVPVPSRSTPIPAVRYYLDLAEAALGATNLDTRLSLSTTGMQEEQADRLLASVDRPLVVLNPGGNRADKRWPVDRFVAVADALAREHGVTVAVSGSPGELPLVRAIVDGVAAATPVVDLVAAGVSLGSLKAVLQRAALLVTNDTGPRHIAAAVGTPVITLFGPTDHRWTTLTGARERVLLAEPFLPEELVADRHPVACAIEKIPATDVIEAAASLLGAAPA